MVVGKGETGVWFGMKWYKVMNSLNRTRQRTGIFSRFLRPSISQSACAEQFATEACLEILTTARSQQWGRVRLCTILLEKDHQSTLISRWDPADFTDRGIKKATCQPITTNKAHHQQQTSFPKENVTQKSLNVANVDVEAESISRRDLVSDLAQALFLKLNLNMSCESKFVICWLTCSDSGNKLC